MDPTEERKKKLEAGKEKLAAFRKKKAKRTKKDDLKAQEDATDVCIHSSGGKISPAEMLSLSDDYSAIDSDQLSFTSGDEWSTEEQEQRPLVYYQAKLANAKQRISELEEALEGKSLALDVALLESKTMRHSHVKEIREQQVFESFSSDGIKITNVESALVWRDELIGQLIQSLQSSGDANIPAVMGQIQALADHVCLLQTQLYQADQSLQEQLVLHQESSQALQNAKAQMLQLQVIISYKDRELDKLAAQMRSPTVIPESSSAHYENQIRKLESELQAKVAECQAWTCSHQDWTAREQELLTSLCAKSEALNALLLAQQSQSRHSETADPNEPISEQEQLRKLEAELSRLRQAHEAEANEIVMLKQKNWELEEKSQDSSQQLESLHVQHETLLLEHAHCLSQLQHLKLLHEKLSSVHLVEVKLELDSNSKEETWLVGEKQHTVATMNTDMSDLEQRSDDLQTKLDEKETESTKCNEEREHVPWLETSGIADMQLSTGEKEKEHGDELWVKKAEWEETIALLEQEVEKLQRRLQSKEHECQLYTEKLIALQDEFLSAEQIHTVKLSEAMYHTEIMEQDMESRTGQLQCVIEEKEKACSEYLSRITALQELQQERQHSENKIGLTKEDEYKERVELLPAKHEVEHSVYEKESKGHMEAQECLEKVAVKEALKKKTVHEEVAEQKAEVVSDQEIEESKRTSLQEQVQHLQAALKLESQLCVMTADRDNFLETLESLSTDIHFFKKNLQSCVIGVASNSVPPEKKLQEGEDQVESLNSEHQHLKMSLSQRQEELSYTQTLLQEVRASLAQTESANSSEVEKLKHQIECLESGGCQEALVAQLENTIAQWQRLQVILQEKEIELHQHQEEMEELQRIGATLKRQHEEEKEHLQSLIDSLKEINWKYEEDIRTLEQDILDLRNQGQHRSLQLSEMGKATGKEEFCNVTSLKESVSAESGSDIQENPIEWELLKRQLCQKDSELNLLQSSIAEKDSELDVIRTELTDKKWQLDHLVKKMSEMGSELNSLQNSLAEKQLQLDNRKSNGEADKEVQIASLEMEHKSECEAQKRGLTDTDGQVSSSENELLTHLTGREAVIEELKSTLALRDSEVSHLRHRLAGKSLEVEERQVSELDRHEKNGEEPEAAEEFRTSRMEKESSELRMEVASQLGDVLQKLEAEDSLLQESSEDGVCESSLFCNMRTKVLEAATDKFRELQQQLSQKVFSFENLLSGKELQVWELRSRLAKRELRTSLTQTWTEYKESCLSSKVSEILDLNNRLQAQSLAIEQWQRKAVSAERFVETLERNLSEREKELTSAVEERNNSLAELESAIIDSDSLNSRLCQALQQVDTLQGEKDSEISELRHLLAGKEWELASVKAQLEEKASEVTTLTTSLDSRSEEVIQLQEAILEKQAQIDQLQSRLKRETKAVNELEQLRKQAEECELELETCVREGDKELEMRLKQEQDHRIADLESELKQVTLENSSLPARVNLQQKVRETENPSAVTEKMGTRQMNENLEALAREKLVLIKELEIVKKWVKEKELKLLEEQTKNEKMAQKLAGSDKTQATLQAFISHLTDSAQEKESALVQLQLELEEQARRFAELTENLQMRTACLEEMIKKNTILQEERCQSEAFLQETACTREMLEQQVTELEQSINTKERHFSDLAQSLTQERDVREQLEHKWTVLDKQYHCLLSTASFVEEGVQHRDALIITQQLELDSFAQKMEELSGLVTASSQALKQMRDSYHLVQSENESVTSAYQELLHDKNDLEQRLSRLQSDLDFQELTATQYMIDSKQLNEKLTQMSETVEMQEALIFDLRHDCHMYVQEMNNLKQELEQKDAASIAIKQEVQFIVKAADESREEKEMLKANFDSCMEDMQQKIGEQEIEVKRLKSQLVEESKTVQQGQEQIKEIFEQQLSQLEDKLLVSETCCQKFQKEQDEARSKWLSAKEEHDHQMEELELSLQSAHLELARMKDHLSRSQNNHECELAGLKRLHEIQTSELEESCLSLERTVSEQKRLFNEQMVKFSKEKNELEQSYEIQLSETEDKRRFSEMEIARLRKHLDEMKHDYEKDLQNQEKSFEARLYELEEKYFTATNEVDRLRKSLMCNEGGYFEERQSLEMKVEELETGRRELHLRNAVLEEEIRMLNEQAHQREEEQNAVETQQEILAEMASQIVQLTQQLETLTKEQREAKQGYEEQIQDWQLKNQQLDNNYQSLLIHVQQTVQVMKKEEEKSAREQLLMDNSIELQSPVARQLELKKPLSACNSPEGQLQAKSDLETVSSSIHQMANANFSQYHTQDNAGGFSPLAERLPIVEGFVAEHSLTFGLAQQKTSLISPPANQEPDFVEEQRDRFQPETLHERLVDTPEQLNVHPIREEEMQEGFQPEISDIFLMEAGEESDQEMLWQQHQLSAGMSPPFKQQFDYAIIYQSEKQEKQEAAENCNCNCKPSASQLNENEEVREASLEKRLLDLQDCLEEEYVTKLRRQEVELTHRFETEREQYRKEMEHHLAQQLKAVKYDWERKFTKALQKVKREMEKRHLRELRQVRQSQYSRLAHLHQYATSQAARESSCDGELKFMPDIAEGSDELGEVVQLLHKENQELAEVRDVLLRQIEISQARDLHSSVQHELQSLMSSRSTGSVTASSSVATGSATEVTTVQRHEAQTLPSETNFLQELEEISHESSQDLPLEWELTTTLMESGDFEHEPEHHRSVWEVFDGRQDCQEVRLRFHKLYKWVANHKSEYQSLGFKFFDNSDGSETQDQCCNESAVDVDKNGCSAVDSVITCKELTNADMLGKLDLEECHYLSDQLSSLTVAQRCSQNEVVEEKKLNEIPAWHAELCVASTSNLKSETNQDDVVSLEKTNDVEAQLATTSLLHHLQRLLVEKEEQMGQLKHEVVNDQQYLSPETSSKVVQSPLELLPGKDDLPTYIMDPNQPEASLQPDQIWVTSSVGEFDLSMKRERNEGEDVSEESSCDKGSEQSRAETSNNEMTGLAPAPNLSADSNVSATSQQAQLSCDDNSRVLANHMSNLIALDLQDRHLAQELTQLQKDLSETKALYSKENVLFQEALNKEKVNKDLVLNRSASSNNASLIAGGFSEMVSSYFNTTSDESEMLQQKLAICLEQNHMLENENAALRTRLREQEAVVVLFKNKMQQKDHATEEWQKCVNHQLAALQKQRSDLLQLIQARECSENVKLSQSVQGALREDSLLQFQEDLLERLEEVDHLHKLLSQKQIELQHCEFERRHLEQLCLLKDLTEVQLMKQKRLMEEQVSEIELHLRERETILVEEKTHLLQELKEKDEQLSQVTRSSTETAHSEQIHRFSSIKDLNVSSVEGTQQDSSFQELKIPLCAQKADRQHMEAIEKLRCKLKREYDIGAARIAESQASASASFWQRQVQH